MHTVYYNGKQNKKVLSIEIHFSLREPLNLIITQKDVKDGI